MSKVKFLLFASTPDMLQYEFVVKVLTGTPEELGRTAVSWGYDGIEFMPDPEYTPDPELLGRMLAIRSPVSINPMDLAFCLAWIAMSHAPSARLSANSGPGTILAIFLRFFSRSFRPVTCS